MKKKRNAAAIEALRDRREAWREIRSRAVALCWTLNRLAFEANLSYSHLKNLSNGYSELNPQTWVKLIDAIERGERGESAPRAWGNRIGRRLRSADLEVGDRIRGRGRLAEVIEVGKGWVRVRVQGEYGVYHSLWVDYTPSETWRCVGALWRDAR